MIIFYTLAGLVLLGITLFAVISVIKISANKIRNQVKQAPKNKTVKPKPVNPNEKW